MLYDSEEAGQVGYDCGRTYLTGGRPLLSLDEQDAVSANLAQGCCRHLKAQQKFIAQFRKGYAARSQVVAASGRMVMPKMLPIKLGNMITTAPVGVWHMGDWPAEILQAIEANAGSILYINRDCRLQPTPNTHFTLTGFYLGEIIVDQWTNTQADQALHMLSIETDAYELIINRACLCYTLKNGQRLLHLQNRDNGWESYLILISHAQYADGIPSGF